MCVGVCALFDLFAHSLLSVCRFAHKLPGFDVYRVCFSMCVVFWYTDLQSWIYVRHKKFPKLHTPHRKCQAGKSPVWVSCVEKTESWLMCFKFQCTHTHTSTKHIYKQSRRTSYQLLAVHEVCMGTACVRALQNAGTIRNIYQSLQSERTWDMPAAGLCTRCWCHQLHAPPPHHGHPIRPILQSCAGWQHTKEFV